MMIRMSSVVVKPNVAPLIRTIEGSKEERRVEGPGAPLPDPSIRLRRSFDSFALLRFLPFYRTWNVTECSTGSPVTLKSSAHVPVVSPFVLRLKM